MASNPSAECVIPIFIGPANWQLSPVDFVNETEELLLEYSNNADTNGHALGSSFLGIHSETPCSNRGPLASVVSHMAVVLSSMTASSPSQGTVQPASPSAQSTHPSEQFNIVTPNYMPPPPLLDFTSPYPYFRFDVPQRSRTSSTLANAIFALSARNLAYTHGYDPLVADQYYSACLDHLIPALSNEDAALDDSLLTATILLRMLEEMDVDIVGSDSHGHLTGTAALLRAAQEQLAANKTPVAPVPRGLRQAAYWIAFRQEIYMSLQTHRPITLSARMCGFDEAHDWCEAPEWVWAQRAIAHCGDALAFAFGGGGGVGASRVGGGARARGRERWSKLIEDNAAWNRVRPRSFDPFFGRVPGLDEAEQPPKPVFPELRVMGNWQVLGYGYNILSRLVLLVHDPSIPKLGPSRKASVAIVDKKLRRDVRTLCSIVNSHLDHGPANIIALVAISMCGDRFTHPPHQRALHDLLTRVHRLHGWPVQEARSQLEDAWGWSTPSDAYGPQLAHAHAQAQMASHRHQEVTPGHHDEGAGMLGTTGRDADGDVLVGGPGP
ncbi:hypothetical protein IWX90DRAFT_490788 [Phyllosticta citrichinensis]|uniref:Uncharacterized protein n=1 Tax=Phyllosticta citrichinensis TaxID=1130410 RepID=A0ABR1XF87_9PEZI